jgi:hypothetical protein
MKEYFAASSFNQVLAKHPAFGVARANYVPEKVWADMKKRFSLEPARVVEYLVFPFDQRWIYYSEHEHLLDRHSPEFARNREANEFLITVPKPRKSTEAIPLFASTLVGLHVHERGSVVIPKEAAGVFGERTANLPPSVWRVVREQLKLKGELSGPDARRFSSRLLHVALAVPQAPAYQSDHKSALSADWAHLPIPKERKLFDKIADVGDQIALLLDAKRVASGLVAEILGEDRAAALGRLSRTDGRQVSGEDLRVNIKYWGGAKGRWVLRPYASAEESHPAWGESTGDLFLSDEVFFANVPAAVWTYQLGGYPVLKKWLSYRQADRYDDKPLNNEDRRWVRAIVQRIAAILALRETLDRLYSEAAANAYTAAELGIER